MRIVAACRGTYDPFMTSTQPSPLNILLSELSSLDADLKDSGNEYQAADAAYDKGEAELRKIVDPRIKRYSEADRAAILRDASTELIRRMDDFSKTRTEAFEKLAELRVRVNQNALASSRQAAAEIVKALAVFPAASTSPVSSTKDLLRVLPKLK